MADELNPQHVKAARLAYEEDRRAHKLWQPHWEDISHSDRMHWIFAVRGKVQKTESAPSGLVVVVG